MTILPPPAAMSATQRAAEITQILATAIYRAQLAKTPNHKERQVGLGFPPAQRVHTTPYQPEKTR
ncbi:conserved hypothetical protein [Gammaproteobacteria bacterium]